MESAAAADVKLERLSLSPKTEEEGGLVRKPKAMDVVKAAIAGRGGTVGATGSGSNATSPSNGSGGSTAAEDASYLEGHPEVRAALNDFVSALLLEKPEDVYDFAAQHFAARAHSPHKDKLIRPLVICGPSGVGKGTLLNLLFQEFGGEFGFSVSHTTRKPRPGEVHGVHYNFTSREAMSAAIEEGRFLEFAQVHTNLYGTSVDAVRKVQKAGQVCVLDIDVQGVQKIKQTDIRPHLVFIAPPDPEQLEARLRGRATESEDAVATRLANARAEIEYGTAPGNFEYILVNDDLTASYARLKAKLIEYYPHLAARAV